MGYFSLCEAFGRVSTDRRRKRANVGNLFNDEHRRMYKKRTIKARMNGKPVTLANAAVFCLLNF